METTLAGEGAQQQIRIADARPSEKLMACQFYAINAMT
jgi:hypothetical protein